MYNEIPQINNFTCKLEITPFEKYRWNCEFTIEQSLDSYRKMIVIENDNTWDSSFLYFETPTIDGDKWVPVSSNLDKSFYKSYQIWDSHLFSQCMYIIKKHSKHRLRILTASDNGCYEEGFIPSVYNEPDKITFEE